MWLGGLLQSVVLRADTSPHQYHCRDVSHLIDLLTYDSYIKLVGTVLIMTVQVMFV